jgi:phage-related protein
MDPLILMQKNLISTPSAWFYTLDVEVTEILTLYFVKNNEEIIYNGNTYIPMNFILDPASNNARGEIQVFTLKVANVRKTMQRYLRDAEGCVGYNITIRQINSELVHLSFADVELTYEILKSEYDNQWAIFTLGAPNPMKRRYPTHRYLPKQCNWVRNFGEDVECKYSGTDLTCTGTYADCYAKGNTRRFGGHFGMDNMKLRLA